MIKRFKHPHKSIFIFAYTYLSMMKIVWPLKVVSLIQVGMDPHFNVSDHHYLIPTHFQLPCY